MITTIVSIGNSKGIRIPKVLLEESGLNNEVELEAKRGEIRILPVKIKKNVINDTLLLSEGALGTDWNRSEENDAWKSLK